MSTMGGRKHCEARTRGQWFDVGRKDGLETMDFRVSWRKSWRPRSRGVTVSVVYAVHPQPPIHSQPGILDNVL